jgi:exopolysaccharide biosynthesis polyprenyl glycosylphosphotransferase
VSVTPSIERATRTDTSAGASLLRLIRERASRRHEPTRGSYVRLVRLGDTTLALVALMGAFLAANLGRMPAGVQEFLELRLTLRNLLLLAAFGAAWRLLCELAGLYDTRLIRQMSEEVRRVMSVCLAGTAAALTFHLISRTGAFTLTAVLSFGAAACAGLLLLRLVLRTLTATGAPAIRDILIVGSGPRAWRAYLDLQGDPHGPHQMLGFVDVDDRSLSDEIRGLWAGSLANLESILMHRPVDEVVIALPIRSQYAEIQKTIETCWRVGVRCKYLADVFDHGRARTRFEQGEQFGAVAIGVAAEDGRLILKRGVDLIGTAVTAVLVLPILLCAVALIKVTSPGPVFYTQERHGLHKRRFRMYKLRTMVADAEARQLQLEASNEAAGPIFKIRDDPRITPVGRFLRRTSIDELPQLWNVFRGDMSLVGPRPLPVRDVQRFTEGALMRRFSVRPGITGLWQISRRGTMDFDDWVELDMRYIDEWSLALDFRILAVTLPAVLRGSGAT